MGNDTPAALGALRVDEAKLKGHVDEVVRSSVEETLNGLLDAEAPQAWLTYLRGGAATHLRRVAEHNAQDLRSLAGLLAHLAELAAGG